MHTRSQRAPLEPIDPEIEATSRRRGGQRRRALLGETHPQEYQDTVENLLEEMNNQGNNNPPPPLDPNQLMQQMMARMETIQAHIERQEAELQRNRGIPIRNIFGEVNIQGPPVNQRVDANTFELKTGLIQMIRENPFAGRATEDPNRHLTKFVEISNTVKQNGVPDDTVKMRLFPFSLIDNAKDWYDSLEPGSITTWADMTKKFLDKFFPISITLKLQAQISQFRIRDQESIGEAYTRFKELIKKCPNHGFTAGHQLSMFYGGLTESLREKLDFGCGGCFLDMGDERCGTMLEKLTSNSAGWSSGRDITHRVAAATDLDPMQLMSQQLILINQKMDNMRGPSTEPQGVVEDVNYVHNGGQQRNYNNNYRPN